MSKTLRVVLWTAVVIAAIIGLGRAFAIRWWRIPQDGEYAWLAASVTPTLRGGDLVVLWRLSSPSSKRPARNWKGWPMWYRMKMPTCGSAIW
jgi:hypothetical protein